MSGPGREAWAGTGEPDEGTWYDQSLPDGARRQAGSAAPQLRLTVGELVLDGMAVRDREAFGADVEAALARLVAARGLAPRQGLPQPVTIARAHSGTDLALAESVASAVWSALCQAPSPGPGRSAP